MEEHYDNDTQSRWNNINLTCGGNCSLRKEINNDNEQSMSETLSIVSGTDSQYERGLNPEQLQQKRPEEDLPSDALSININQDTLASYNTPERSSERQRKQQLEDDDTFNKQDEVSRGGKTKNPMEPTKRRKEGLTISENRRKLR